MNASSGCADTKHNHTSTTTTPQANLQLTTQLLSDTGLLGWRWMHQQMLEVNKCVRPQAGLEDSGDKDTPQQSPTQAHQD